MQGRNNSQEKIWERSPKTWTDYAFLWIELSEVFRREKEIAWERIRTRETNFQEIQDYY